jgi:hypothetical protein
MSVNRYQPHVFVLPEDDANRQLANGFLLYPSLSIRNIQVLTEVGGWTRLLDRFKSDHVSEMQLYPDRFMVLLIDFDDSNDRLRDAQAAIPRDLSERVFILGVRSEPEALRKAKLGSFENIGLKMAQDCHEGTDAIWGHKLLRHNGNELVRLRRCVRPILFQSI